MSDLVERLRVARENMRLNCDGLDTGFVTGDDMGALDDAITKENVGAWRVMPHSRTLDMIIDSEQGNNMLEGNANRMASALKSTMQVTGLLAVESTSVAARG